MMTWASTGWSGKTLMWLLVCLLTIATVDDLWSIATTSPNSELLIVADDDDPDGSAERMPACGSALPSGSSSSATMSNSLFGLAVAIDHKSSTVAIVSKQTRSHIKVLPLQPVDAQVIMITRWPRRSQRRGGTWIIRSRLPCMRSNG